jgi:hypothetical protein
VLLGRAELYLDAPISAKDDQVARAIAGNRAPILAVVVVTDDVPVAMDPCGDAIDTGGVWEDRSRAGDVLHTVEVHRRVPTELLNDCRELLESLRDGDGSDEHLSLDPSAQDGCDQRKRLCVLPSPSLDHLHIGDQLITTELDPVVPPLRESLAGPPCSASRRLAHTRRRYSTPAWERRHGLGCRPSARRRERWRHRTARPVPSHGAP